MFVITFSRVLDLQGGGSKSLFPIGLSGHRYNSAALQRSLAQPVIVCCEAVRSVILAKVWLLVYLCK